MINDRIIHVSLEALDAISKWVEEQERVGKCPPVTVLIGGWAVYSYNPWYGSVDIDLITNADIRKDLMRYLVEKHGFSTDRSEGTTTVVKNLTIDGIRKTIRIDFFSKSGTFSFEGVPGLSEGITLNNLDKYSIIKDIGNGVKFRIPDRTFLLILKLNASWDRNYRLKSNRSPDRAWEQSKLIKDYSDIFSLMDPELYDDDLDFELLGETLQKFGFLRDHIAMLPYQRDAIDNYGRLSAEQVKSICDNILQLTR